MNNMSKTECTLFSKNCKVLLKPIIDNPPEIPSYKTLGAAGADVRSAEEFLIAPFERKIVKTGYKIAIAPNFEVQVRSRSGLAYRNGVIVLNSPGTIDSDYRGELKIILANFGDESFKVNFGDRIAQLVIAPAFQYGIIKSEFVNATERNEGGFGSTGVN